MTALQILPWLTGISLILGIVNMLWTWRANQTREIVKQIEGVRCDVETVLAKIDGHDSRIQSVESEMKHLPTKDEIMALKLQLSEGACRRESAGREVSIAVGAVS